MSNYLGAKLDSPIKGQSASPVIPREWLPRFLFLDFERAVGIRDDSVSKDSYNPKSTKYERDGKPMG